MPTVRLRQIDDTTRGDHYYLTPEDECVFLYEYTAGAGRQHATNQLIFNLKKKKGAAGYNYKAPAIERCAQELTPAINERWLDGASFVPVPPSKIKTDDAYDDRISQICQKLRPAKPVDVRELIEQIASTDAVHDGNGISPEELKRNYRVNAALLTGSSKNIAVVDDLLTPGAHFRAVKDMIVERVPTPASWASSLRVGQFRILSRL